MGRLVLLALSYVFVLVLMVTGANSQGTRSFTIVNNCKESIWPGITNSENFNGSGFQLKPGQSADYTAPAGWSGRIWARTGCNFDKDGNGTCLTGGCGTSLKCTVSGTPPMSIAEFTLGDVDYYDVSLVDGLNLPIVITPLKGKENCTSVGCDGDLRQNCPSDLVLKSDGKVIACRSACNVFNTDEYCCRGSFGTSDTCKPTNYSQVFKSACPVAYSYAFDDKTSIKTCTGAEYVVSFCSSRNGTLCSYRDNKLTCNGSTSSGSIFRQSWSLMMLGIVLLLMFSPNQINI